MTKVKPFRALVYNQEKIKDLSCVVCPPYDVISPERQEHYHGIDQYNFIHILLSKAAAGEDKYAKAGNLFGQWQKSGVFTRDKEPAIYFYSQLYNLNGEKKTRYGFMALLRLGDSREARVFAHENTRSAAKEDRLKLIRQVRANLSPIFVVFQDKKRVIPRITGKYLEQLKPAIAITDDEQAEHKVWRITSPEIVKIVQEGLSDENIFIADGHHRYEVACAYQEEMRQKLGRLTGQEECNYILAYFTSAESRGLTILPIHRLVKLEARRSIQEIISGLKENFVVEEVKDKEKFFFLLKKGGESEHIIGMYKDAKFWFLRLKNVGILDRIISDKPRDYRLLDVSILNYLVLNNVLGLGLEDKDSISFNPCAQELIAQVDADPGSIAFFLNPVKVGQIMSVALEGEKMPPKSTYFYPKVLSGLVINKLEP
ncbi:MAG: DUF1015 domain-containing protein [Candidatus Omnitrophota bacterium]